MQTKCESKNRVIIIDDNPSIHEDFKKILVSDVGDTELRKVEAAFFGKPVEDCSDVDLNIELESAFQGAEGHQKVMQSLEENRPFALAFVDMRMPPGWDGLTTIEHLWEADPNLQVVICSAYSDNTWEGIARRIGRSDKLLILKKPFDNAEVLQLAAALIEKRRLAELAFEQNEKLENAFAENQIRVFDLETDIERILNATETAIIKLDSAGLITRWNNAASETFRLQETNALGCSISGLPIEWEQADVVQAFCDSDIVDHASEAAVPSTEGTTQNPVTQTAFFNDLCGTRKCVQITRHADFKGEKAPGMILSVVETSESKANTNLQYEIDNSN